MSIASLLAYADACRANPSRVETDIIIPMADQIVALTAECNRLAAFKDYVHKRLDERVPTFEEESKDGSCRIGKRLDWLFHQPRANGGAS